MINDFADFCTWMFVIIDDIMKQLETFTRRPGPTPICSDSELITMAIVGECKGWDVEIELLSEWKNYPHLFPNVPTQSRFNRRRRNLMQIINIIRQTVLKMLDISQDKYCVIDSLPIPVVQFYLVPGSTGDWKAYQARYGRVKSKKETIFGYKLHLLVTMGGLILDFELASANAPDLDIGIELLSEHTDVEVLGDKGYISAEKAKKLWDANRVRLRTLPRRNQKNQLPASLMKLYNAFRQIIETVNGQLSEQFNIEKNHAHTFWGLCARLYTKLTAHTLSIYINRLLGNPNFL
jgi:hypothetical protein